MLTVILLMVILIGFVLMTARILKQEVAMPLVALIAVILAGSEGLQVLQEGAREFAKIALVFTAVAVPAHLLQRAGLFDWLGMWVGEVIGGVHHKTKISLYFLIPLFTLTMVYVFAALFHNTTSILVSAIIILVIAKSYSLKGIPILCGALIASNLGGFSTRWGDTPNIIESATWGLTHQDFLVGIMPLNISALLIVIGIVAFWLKRITGKQVAEQNNFTTIHELIKFRRERQNMSLDKRLIVFGVIGLLLAIIGPLFFLPYEIGFSALAIIVSVAGDYSDHRREGLFALGIETYATLASIFVLAQVFTHSHIGIAHILEQWLKQSGDNVFAITFISYFGTLLTEAASWASAASPIVYAHNPTHLGAWALGSGIFAGSSSLITAASAGIILSQETKNFPPGYVVNFRSYVVFGLLVSFALLLYYSVILSIFYV